MSDSLFSTSWYRVAGLKPRLRGHAEIHRHIYRGERWYVLQDHASGQFQRFNPAAYFLIGLMDGRRSVEEIWATAKERLGEDAPTQEEMINLLSQLHAADILQMDVPPDIRELSRRFEKKTQRKWKQKILNPLAMSFSLFDPEKLLIRLEPLARLVFSWPAAVLFLAVMATGVILAGLHWPELTQDVADRVLAPRNLVFMWLLFPFLKVFHELGHALAVKRFGGEVHDVGIMFLVLTPIPYVDASSSLAFRNKWERILVGAGGLMVELFMAAIALILWVNMGPGTLRGIIYNIILIAGVSSVFFNGNPLLRYDAYYILGDLLEIPNLGTRSVQYMGYLVQRFLLKIQDAEPPVSSRGERAWFVLYAVSSFIYRIFIYVAIIGFIAGKFFIIGILMAIWAVGSMLVFPLVKALRYLFSSPKLGHRRSRAIAISAGMLAVASAIVAFVPVPLCTRAEGVVWLPDEAIVRADTEGFIEQLKAVPGTRVKTGDVLVVCSDPLLNLKISVLEAQQRELQVEYDVKEQTDQVQAQITAEEIKQVSKELEVARFRLDLLTIRSKVDGVFFVPLSQDLPGRFVKRGEVIGYVLKGLAATARVAIFQSDIDLVRQKTRGVEVRLPEKIMETLPAKLLREVPAATEQLPSSVLGNMGGGAIAVDPRDTKGIKAFEKIFLFDIELPPTSAALNVGGRVYVRLHHGWEPLAGRWVRGIRGLLLRRFNV